MGAEAASLRSGVAKEGKEAPQPGLALRPGEEALRPAPEFVEGNDSPQTA
jgi:hypothetical protein